MPSLFTYSTTARSVLLCAAIAGSAWSDTSKAPQPVAFEAGKPTPTPTGPPPEVTIVSPESLGVVPCHEQKLPYQGIYMTVPCMMNPGTKIQIQVKNWPMKRGGNGVAIVVDNKVGKTIYDVSKPIPLTDLMPIPKTGEDAGDAPAAEGGWHFVAAFATLPNGESVKTPAALAVAPFIIGKDSNIDVPGLIQRKAGLLVVNVPLLGKPVSHNDGPGFKPADPDNVMVDFLIWNAPAHGLVGTGWGTSINDGGNPGVSISERVGPAYVRHLEDGANHLVVYLETHEEDWQWFDDPKYVLYTK